MEHHWNSKLLQKANDHGWTQSSSGLLRDPSEDDLENNCPKQLCTYVYANSRAGELSIAKSTQKYVLTQQTMVSRDACLTTPGLKQNLTWNVVCFILEL